MKTSCLLSSLVAGLTFGYLASTASLLAGTKPGAGGSDVANVESASALASKWGIQVSSIRLSANGYMVDFRYKVLDPQKAATLADRDAKPYLIDQASGAKLYVPRSPKVGPLRQSAEQLTAGRVYFTFFSNRSHRIKPGSKVTVVVGEFKAENLVVE